MDFVNIHEYSEYWPISQMNIQWIFMNVHGPEYSACEYSEHYARDRSARLCYVQGKRADKKLARGEVPPLVLKIEGVVGPETAFAFLKLCLTS